MFTQQRRCFWFWVLVVVSLLGFLTVKAFAQVSPAGGNWLELDGIDDYAEAPASDSLDVGDEDSENLTIEAWIYPRDFPAVPFFGENEMVIAAKSGAYRLSIQRNSSGFPGFRFEVTIDTGNKFAGVASFSRLVLYQWYHIAGVFDNSANTIALYIDGVEKVSTPVDANLKNSSEPLIVGGPPPNPDDEYFDGRIDEVRISDIARYTSDFTPPSGPFTSDGNTRGLWHFDEDVGATIFADESGNGNTLTGHNDAHTLPVHLSAFTAVSLESGVMLKWRTESEVNNMGFDIYRSDKEDSKYIKVNAKLIQGAGTDATPHDYSFTDNNVNFGQTYYYYIEDVDFAGKKSKSPILKITAGQESEVKIIDKSNIIFPSKLKTIVIPTEFALLQNYPNPFNPETWIPFALAQNAPVTISIYDTKGQLVRTLHLGTKPAGFYLTKDKAIYWDGRDNLGEKVSSGVYYYTLQAGDFNATRKLVIVK